MFPHNPTRPRGGPHRGTPVSGGERTARPSQCGQSERIEPQLPPAQPIDVVWRSALQSLSMMVALTVAGTSRLAPSTEPIWTVKVSVGSFTLSSTMTAERSPVVLPGST
jgi:hypothetical protein